MTALVIVPVSIQDANELVLAAGWHIVAEVRAKSWSCISRPRVDRYPLQEKFRWEA